MSVGFPAPKPDAARSSLNELLDSYLGGEPQPHCLAFNGTRKEAGTSRLLSVLSSLDDCHFEQVKAEKSKMNFAILAVQVRLFLGSSQTNNIHRHSSSQTDKLGISHGAESVFLPT